MSDVLFAGLFAVGAAVLSALIMVIYQYCQYRKQLELNRLAEIASAKKAVIQDLVAYRFVLGGKGNHALPTTHFNAALSRVPVLFSSNKDCLDKYRSIGNDFTAEKYYQLIVALMKDVPLSTDHLDQHIFENVPSVSTKTDA